MNVGLEESVAYLETILANQTPNSAHAVLTEQTKDGQKGYLVSIRAPLTNKRDADTLASKFPSGGGRKAAAGINFLPEAQLVNIFAGISISISKHLIAKLLVHTLMMQ